MSTGINGWHCLPSQQAARRQRCYFQGKLVMTPLPLVRQLPAYHPRLCWWCRCRRDWFLQEPEQRIYRYNEQRPVRERRH